MTQPSLARELLFDLPGHAKALFTDRSHGNLSTLRGPAHQCAQATREDLRETLSLTALLAGPQVHGTTVQRVTVVAKRPVVAGVVGESHGSVMGTPTESRPLEMEADGRATSLHRVGMMVLTADCLPVIVAAEGAVAALHAGWRGLAAGVLEEGVAAVRELSSEVRELSAEVRELSSEWGARAGARVRARGASCEELVAILGPCAGVCCYEVGPEVHRLFPHDSHPDTSSPHGPHRHRVPRNLDLKAVARHRLLRAGVHRVEVVDMCTICDHRFFSHRRQAAHAGRQAGVVWLD